MGFLSRKASFLANASGGHRMKTSKADFERFKSEFIKWQKRLGLTQYRIIFEHKKINGAYAELFVQEKEKVATAILSSELHNEKPGFNDGSESHAFHEVIHLLLHRICYLGKERWTGSDEIPDEAEAIVVRLENAFAEYKREDTG